VTNANRVKVGDISLDRLTMNKAVDLVFRHLGSESDRVMVIETVNAQFVCMAREAQNFSDVLSKANIVVADGISVVAASRILGNSLPERVAGIDLLLRLCEKASQTGRSVYFFGGKDGVSRKAADRLREQFPGLVVAGTDTGFASTPQEEAEALNRIKCAAPEILFVGMGVPKQEYWIEQHASDLHVKVVIGVGGSFDVLSGDIPRAPVWMQKAGLEWLFRLLREPRRLWRRYILGNMRFLQIVAFQWAAQRNFL
jgi:N-acetylglucosaminyldiphosphoundecaprenol N-acetyl-beta-D-mannosaminyltransferase